ncbi:DUF6225 family protein [Streptomyces sp. NBC_00846]|uniref:DUF6225 family protein n=1 Tax=Streptomyces sp. NBC_00846 TaxID=2975849 RepID=UPI00386370C0|nr:DUF6225 family protein [Streptomyces sp. NBC_00846]
MTSLDDVEPYEHAVPEWTVGELRQALAGLPDALPVRVAVPQVPTTLHPDEEQDARYVVTGTSDAAPRYDTLLRDGDEVMILLADYPSATYVRRPTDVR